LTPPLAPRRLALEPEKSGLQEERERMPTYEYRCTACGKKFSLILSIGEHDAKKPKCPKCQSTKVEQQFGHFFSKTSRKS
jgi:putative FmdB family regulatory protein